MSATLLQMCEIYVPIRLKTYTQIIIIVLNYVIMIFI